MFSAVGALPQSFKKAMGTGFRLRCRICGVATFCEYQIKVPRIPVKPLKILIISDIAFWPGLMPECLLRTVLQMMLPT